MAGSVIAAIAGFVCYLGVSMLLLRRSSASPAVVVTLAALAMYPATLAATLLLGRTIGFWPFSAAYWFLSLIFLMVFGAVYKSISLRILLDLLERPGRSDEYAAVMQRYVSEESFERRLLVMLDAGLAARGADGFRLTEKGRRISSIVRRVQAVFAIEASG
jgi:hypothetical protein